MFFFYFILLLISLAFIGVIAWLIYEFCLSIYHKTLRYEITPSIAIVGNKEYTAAYTTTTMIWVGKTMVPQVHFHDAEYNVYLIYNQKSYPFNNKDLYDNVDTGHKINVLVHKGYNKNNELQHIYLSINN